MHEVPGLIVVVARYRLFRFAKCFSYGSQPTRSVVSIERDDVILIRFRNAPPSRIKTGRSLRPVRILHLYLVIQGVEDIGCDTSKRVGEIDLISIGIKTKRGNQHYRSTK